MTGGASDAPLSVHFKDVFFYSEKIQFKAWIDYKILKPPPPTTTCKASCKSAGAQVHVYRGVCVACAQKSARRRGAADHILTIFSE